MRLPWPLPSPLRELPAALRFLTRLPLPPMAFESPDGPPDIARLAPALPLAGTVIGVLGAAALLLASGAGLGPFIAATLAIGVLVAITGAFHEDGLADTADALGGSSPARRLDIMKDSRIGTFGALALVLAVLLRIGALERLALANPWHGAAALVGAATVARLGGLWILFALPPARGDGLARGIGRPDTAALGLPFLLAIGVCGILVVPALGPAALAAGLTGAAALTYGVQRLAARQFGGQTGDVAGAATQGAEIAFLIGLLIFAPHP